MEHNREYRNRPTSIGSIDFQWQRQFSEAKIISLTNGAGTNA